MRLITLLTLFITVIMAHSQTSIYLTANGQTKTATLADNDAARQLKALLEQGAVTVNMSDYGGFEKVGSLLKSLPRSDRQITTEPGDIMLYQGNSIVIFYGSNSWAYTPLGVIDGATASDIKSFLNGSDVSVTLSLSSTAAIDVTEIDADSVPVVYDIRGNRIELDGRQLSSLPAGLYIVNGRKRYIR